MADLASENWAVLCGLFPDRWQDQARESGAVERLRGFSSIDALMRTLLLHIAHGYSLRETSVLAKASGLGAASDVALLKRLHKAGPWFRSLCLALLTQLPQHRSLRGYLVDRFQGAGEPLTELS